MRALRSMVMALAFSSIAAASASAQLVNGGFEVDADADGVPDGWTGDSVEIVTGIAAEGSNAVDMNQGSPGTLEQTFGGLTSGTEYAVTFQLSQNDTGQCGEPIGALEATAGGQTAVFRAVDDLDGGTTANPVYTLRGFGFVASGATTTLSFASLSPSCGGPLLDDVVVEPCAAKPGAIIAAGATVTGTAGDDIICGTGAAQTINGGDGADLIFGGGGADRIFSGDGDDTVDGGGGDDFLVGGAGFDALSGAAGVDTATSGDDADSVSGGSGDDETLDGNLGDDFIHGGDGRDLNLYGSDGDDVFFGGRSDAGYDRFYGQAGGDQFDVYDGVQADDPGIDRVLYADDGSIRSGPVTIAIDGIRNDGDAAVDGGLDDVGSAIESITGSAASDQISDTIGGNNTFSGREGDDLLSGAGGTDFFAGGTDADTFVGGGDADRVTYHLAGYDTTTGVTVTLGDGGNDGVDTGPGPGSEFDDVSDDIEFIYGSDGDDSIDASGYTGGALPSDGVSLFGFAGADSLTGSPGNDYVNGGAGSDTVDCRAGDDMFVSDPMDPPAVDCETPA